MLQSNTVQPSPPEGIERPILSSAQISDFIAIAMSLHYEVVDSRESEGSRHFFERATLVDEHGRVGENSQAGARLIEFAESEQVKEVFRRRLQRASTAEIIISKFQVNVMRENCEIEVHNHALMELAAVLVLQRADKGGLHFTCANYRRQGEVICDPPVGSFLLNSGETLHGVTKVEAGEPRIALVWSVNRLI